MPGAQVVKVLGTGDSPTDSDAAWDPRAPIRFLVRADDRKLYEIAMQTLSITDGHTAVLGALPSE